MDSIITKLEIKSHNESFFREIYNNCLVVTKIQGFVDFT